MNITVSIAPSGTTVIDTAQAKEVEFEVPAGCYARIVDLDPKRETLVGSYLGALKDQPFSGWSGMLNASAIGGILLPARHAVIYGRTAMTLETAPLTDEILDECKAVYIRRELTPVLEKVSRVLASITARSETAAPEPDEIPGSAMNPDILIPAGSYGRITGYTTPQIYGIHGEFDGYSGILDEKAIGKVLMPGAHFVFDSKPIVDIQPLTPDIVCEAAADYLHTLADTALGAGRVEDLLLSVK